MAESPAAALGLSETAGSPSSALPDGPGTARRIAQQVAGHPVLRTGGSAELSLAPEELGHLRLRVEGTEANLRIVIEAARPETADLMRRHVDALRQELRQEGLDSVGVSIGSGGGASGGDPAPDRGPREAWPALAAQAAGPEPALPPASAAAAPWARDSAGRIDLRF